MRRCAVIGSPISHSLSPAIHRAAYAAAGLTDLHYGRHEVDIAHLAGFLDTCRRDAETWVGLSVTAPCKRALLDHGVCDQVAEELQSANTLVFGREGDPDRVYNTDVTGMLAALGRAGVTRAATMILVGGGATARSALYVGARLGVGEVVVLARDEARARNSLAPIARQAGIELRIAPFGTGPALPPRWGGRADLLVSTVPTQLGPDYATGLVGASRAVFELVYTHHPSDLNRAASGVGACALHGLHLLVYQAVDQLRLMIGVEADPDHLLGVALAALDNHPGASSDDGPA